MSFAMETYAMVAVLAVSLVTLTYSTAALLGKYLAIADGYRRCQPSVLGPWAKSSRSRWNWTHFRYERLYVVPEFAIRRWTDIDYEDHPSLQTTALQPVGIALVTGSTESRERTLAPGCVIGLDTTEVVSWFNMLESLHWHEYSMNLSGYHRALPVPERTLPGIRYRKGSWDSMPPDIIRPLAFSTIADIAILARWLGMKWTDFRPQDGLLRAEGNGHAFFSSFKSIGIVLHYLRTGASSADNHYIQRQEADMLGFGILAGHVGLKVPTFKIGTIEEVYATADFLDPSQATSQKIKDVRGIEPTCTFGFSDLIPMAAPMMRVRGSTIVRVPVPTQYCVGLTCHKEGFTTFHSRLQSHISTHPSQATAQTHWVLHQYDTLRAAFPEWENEALAQRQLNNRSLAFLEDVHTCWDRTTDYFLALENPLPRTPALPYLVLVAAHLRHAVNYWGDAWQRVRERTTRGADDADGWLVEGAHCYWDYLPGIVADVRAAGFEGTDEVVHEAWFSLMLRAFCWWRCHYMVGWGEEGGRVEQGVEVGRLPARYWGSEMQVFME